MAGTPFTPAHISLARARHLPLPNAKGVWKAVPPCGHRKGIGISANPTEVHCTDRRQEGARGWGRALSTCCWRTQQTLREVAGQGEEPDEAGAEAQLTVGIRIQTETRVRTPSVTRVGG